MNDGKYFSGLAGSDLTNYQYCGAKFDSNGNIIPAAAATDDIVGIIEVNGTSGNPANFRFLNAGGTYLGLAGGSISRGNKLTVNSSGQLIATTNSGDHLVGEALDTGVTSGQVFRFIIYKATYPA